jgi:rhodanese-related sulfurtransferase
MFRSLFTNPARAPKTRTAVEQIDARGLYNLMANEDSRLELVDVRTPGEYANDGHIPGSRLLPLSSLAQRINELPDDRTIVCICRSGSRSYTACEMLATQGFKAINLSGGMIGWKRAGLTQN